MMTRSPKRFIRPYILLPLTLFISYSLSLVPLYAGHVHTVPNNGLTASVGAKTDALCGTTDGSATINASGGTAPYSYSLDGAGFNSNNTFTGLAPGFYQVTVRDNVGCIFQLPLQIIAADGPTPSIVASNDPSCAGLSDGSISLSATGGAGSYRYSMNGTNFQSFGLFDNLASGQYNLIVRDGAGCDVIIADILVDPEPLTANLVALDDVDCNGNDNGSVEISGAGGTPPYQYSDDNISFSTNGAFTALTPGAYTLYVQDDNNCQNSLAVQINEPLPLSLNVDAQTNILCNGSNSGSIEVSGVEGTGPYEYSIDNTTFSTTNIFPNLTAGNYEIFVRDDNDCTASQIISLTEPTPLDANIVSKTDVSCNSTPDGSVTLEGVGGVAPYFFSDDGINPGTNPTFNNLALGTYTFYVHDANSCVSPIQVEIVQPTDLSISIGTVVDVACSGESTGSLTAVVTGGNPGYMFSVNGSNLSPTPNIGGLSAGNYTITVVDAGGCTQSATTAITEPSPLVLNLDSQVDNVCNGESNGSVTLSGSGGNNSSYLYSSDGTNFASTNTFPNLPAGTNTFSVQDGNGCITPIDVTITEPAALSVLASNIDPVSCNGLSDGEVTLSGSGGTGSYSYSVDGINFLPNNVFQLLPAGSFNFSIQDGNDCISTTTVDVSEPSPIILTVSNIVDITCATDTDGQATLSATGGTPNYQFSVDGGGFQSATALNNLAGGTHTVVVQDNNGCQITDNFDIAQPSELILSVVDSSHISCFNGNDGTITVTGTGGNGAYEYSIGAGFGSDAVFDNLFAAIHTITLRDATGCTDNINVELSQPTEIQIAVDLQQDPVCEGENTGEIQVSGSGGTAPYKYSINSLGFYDPNSFPNLNAGSYLVEVLDDNGCIANQSVTLTAPPAIAIAAVKLADVSCFGGTDGQAEAQASGGNGGFSFTWNPGNFSGPTISNLPAGNFTVEATDALGCSSTATVRVDEPAELVASHTVDQGILCNGDNTGILTVSAVGGSGGYSFTWNTGPTSPTINNLGAGTYTATVEDGNNCTTSIDITLTDPEVLSANINTINISCNGVMDGSVEAVVTGGTPNYLFEWNNNPALNTANISSLSAGTYDLVVTDGNNCQTNATTSLVDPAPISLLTSQVDETCTLANGTATVTPSGGSGGFSYSWSTLPIQDTQTALGLSAGVYTVTVLDGNNCQASTSVTLIDLEAPVLQLVSESDVSCFGLNDGSAEVSASLGTGTYTYTWNTSPQITGPTANSLAPGSYSVLVDDGRCTAELAIEITEPEALSANIDQFSVPSCFDRSDGTATVSVTGGSGGYTFLWNTSPAQTTQDISDLPGGSYSVQVEDQSGCQASAAVTLTPPAPLDVQITTRNASCFGTNTGTANAIVTGGTPPYLYNWSSGSSSSSADLLGAGAYSLQVVDDQGCQILDVLSITEPPELVVSTTQSDLLCFDSSNGTAEALVSGGIGPYTYAWSNGATTAAINGLTSGTYDLTVTDSSGCDINSTITLDAPAEILINIVDMEESFCDLANGRIEVEASGGTPGYSYSWNINQSGPSITNVAGTPFDSLYVVTVLDANACTQSREIPFENLGIPNAEFTLDRDPLEPILLSKGNVRFINTSTGASTYEWDFGDGSQNSTAESPVHNFLEEGNYTITLMAFDENMACPESFQLAIEVILDGRIYVPNAFSPNGDGINDNFIVTGLGVEEFEMLIFDQWGREVRRFTDMSEQWNGLGKNGREAEEGVYMYVIKSKLNTGSHFTKAGSITLLR